MPCINPSLRSTKKILSLVLILTLLYAPAIGFGQKHTAIIKGVVLDENENALARVSVTMLGQQRGIATTDSGRFSIRVPADKALALIFSYTGYRPTQQNFLLNEGEEENVTIRLEKGAGVLEGVTVKSEKDRSEAGLIHPNPRTIINIPSPVTGVESMLKVFVGSNNELTSQYSVRGGNYDENLVYVNDFEIFRPYLVQNGQQEGLSFINPELVKNINFYTGGFQARYGDKMSSVLDIQYNTPKTFAGSAYVSLLEQGLHVEGIGINGKLSYLIGLRNKSNRSLLSSQETQGNYIPSSADVQSLIDYRFSDRWQFEFLGNYSRSRFTLIPAYSELTTSIFTPYFTKSLGLNTAFEGQERDAYSTAMAGFSASFQPTARVKLKWLASRFEDDELENTDITGAYLFGDRDFDPSSSTYGMITNPLGSGLYQNYSRDQLHILNYNLSHKGSVTLGQHLLQWGAGYDKTVIHDKINEWQYQDSAGYSLPNSTGTLQLSHVIYSNADLSINKLNTYVQDNIAFTRHGIAYTLQGGARLNYNDLNRELLLSPRIGASLKPNWKRDIIFRGAAGIYDQPPFYRELRRHDGTVNTQVKAQRSYQGILGFDYNFTGFNGRPLRLTTEGYYKYMTHVDPYDIDNVRIRYFGDNNAKAYTAGVDVRLFGELVKDAESWVSLGLMRSREILENDVYTVYKTDSLNRPVDSSSQSAGWLRRPTDRMISLGMFLQDYLATNKNFKVYLNTLYGSNLPYNIPGSIQYRNALTIPAYLRIDIGFSALLLDPEKQNRRSHSPFRSFQSVWATLEVFNLIDRANTISYLLIKDFKNDVYTIPNRLTPRLLNFKIVARW